MTRSLVLNRTRICRLSVFQEFLELGLVVGTAQAVELSAKLGRLRFQLLQRRRAILIERRIAGVG